MKIKIVHLTSSLKVGGAESLLLDLLRNLPDTFENHVIYFYDGPNVEKIKQLGISTYHVKGLFCKYDPVFFIRLFFLIKKLKPNKIHSLLWAANFSSSIVARVLRIPIICALHLGSNIESTTKNGSIRKFLDRITFQNSNKLIAVSDQVALDIKKYYPAKLIDNKLLIIKNGIDFDYIVKKGMFSKKLKTDFLLTEDHFIIGTVGRFIPRKRHKFLIECFSNIYKLNNNLRLILLGQGPLEAELKEFVKSLKLSEVILFISSNEAYSFYPLFDCFILPSEQEGLSIALLEAMSFGIPSILTNETNNHEVVITGKNGFVIGLNDRNKMEDLIVELYKNIDLRKAIGNAAKTTVAEAFSICKMVNSYRKIFEEK